MDKTYTARDRGTERFRRVLKSEPLGSVYQIEDDEEALITDLIADALHYAKHTGLDAEAILRMATMHFEAETERTEAEDG